MRVSSILQQVSTYPFVRLEQAKREAAATGVSVLDFGVGDPQEPTDELIRRTLVESVHEVERYPVAAGLPPLRDAIAGWVGRRFGVELDPDREIVPTLGSKEAIFSFAQIVLDGRDERDLVVVTEPGYPVAERGALFARAEVLRAPLHERNAFLPDLDAIDDETWRRVALFWLNYPNNPTGAVASPALFERLAALAEEHDFLLCSDEAYSELWFDAPPGSALQVPSRRNVVVFNTLSKRSSMTGYRSGFVAAHPDVVSALRVFRPSIGTAPQDFIQRTSVVAWQDEAHVERARERYRRKRDIVLPALETRRWRVAGGGATFYVWVEVPTAETSEAFATRLLRETGIVVAPGSFFGPSGEGYFRIALVPPEEECRRAAALLAEVKEVA